MLLQGLAPDLPLNRPCTMVRGEMTLDHLPEDPGHVRRFPRKHIDVCPEGGDERAFLFVPQLYPYGDSLLGVVPKTDRLGEGAAVGR